MRYVPPANYSAICCVFIGLLTSTVKAQDTGKVGDVVRRGRALFEAGDLQNAERLAAQAIPAAPDSVDVLILAGDIALKQHEKRFHPWHISRGGPTNALIGDLQNLTTLERCELEGRQIRLRLEDRFPEELRRADAAFAQAQKIDPKDRRAQRGKAATAFLTGQKHLALKLVDAVLANEPANGEFHFMRGRLCNSLLQFDAGRSSLIRASQLLTNDPEPHFWLLEFAWLLGHEGDVQHSLNWFARYQPVSRWNYTVRAHVNRLIDGNGGSRIGTGQSDGFENDFVRDYPNAWEAWYFRAAARFLQQRYQDALADVSKSLTLLDDDIATYRLLRYRAMIYQQLNEHRAAVADLNGAIDAEPDAALCYGSRIESLQALGLDDEALADREQFKWLLTLFKYNRELQLKPGKAGVWVEYGRFLQKAGRHRSAFGAFSEALTLDQRSHSALTGRANVSLKMNQYQRAVEDCNRAIELGATTRAWSIRGDAWLKLGNPAAALEDFRKAMRLDDAVQQAERLLKAAG